MAEPVLTDTNPRASVFTTRVTWHHTLGDQAACLGRLVVPAAAPAAAIVLSELAQNPDSLGISGDFPAAAAAAWALLAPHHAGISPAGTAWYAHHGPFSSYDPTGPETLTEVTLSTTEPPSTAT